MNFIRCSKKYFSKEGLPAYGRKLKNTNRLGVLLSTYKDHQIYMYADYIIYAYNLKGKCVDIMIECDINSDPRSIEIHRVVSSYKPEIRAYEVYKHLISQHDFMIISGDEHTYGGMMIWKKLQKQKNINMFAWNPEEGSVESVDDFDFDDIYVTYKDLGDDNTGEAHRVMEIRLVAHKI